VIRPTLLAHQARERRRSRIRKTCGTLPEAAPGRDGYDRGMSTPSSRPWSLVLLAPFAAVLLCGCAADDGAGNGDAPIVDAGPADGGMLTCGEAPPPVSACDNVSSVVQGTVSLPAGATGATRGDLVFFMMHRRHGNAATGGHPHWYWQVPDIDLATPYSFSLDMCDGNAIMWSEENCEFNLIVMLDDDGPSSQSTPWLPEPGEPAALAVFELHCHAGAAACLEVELGCTDGSGCVAYDDPGDCECSPHACESESAICRL
jgi:hypothetical protein